ncbi:hypothetical protein EDD15DRAFT_1617968 [Pisolithus albus]|nr:hypothetical protein EDD15DRAFT_1617968 [Pisolithus albus]
MLLNLSSWRTTPWWCWPAWKSSSRTTSVSTICRGNSKPCRTRHPVPVPAIVVWNPEVLDKGKNMWTSCRIRVTSCPNATASQPSIVHFGWYCLTIVQISSGHLAEFWGSDALIQWNCIPHAFVLTGSQPMGLPSPPLGILRAVLLGHHVMLFFFFLPSCDAIGPRQDFHIVVSKFNARLECVTSIPPRLRNKTATLSLFRICPAGLEPFFDMSEEHRRK